MLKITVYMAVGSGAFGVPLVTPIFCKHLNFDLWTLKISVGNEWSQTANTRDWWKPKPTFLSHTDLMSPQSFIATSFNWYSIFYIHIGPCRAVERYSKLSVILLWYLPKNGQGLHYIFIMYFKFCFLRLTIPHVERKSLSEPITLRMEA